MRSGRSRTVALVGQTGIRVRHSRRCRSNAVGACNCAKTYEASVYSARDGKRIRKENR